MASSIRRGGNCVKDFTGISVMREVVEVKSQRIDVSGLKDLDRPLYAIENAKAYRDLPGSLEKVSSEEKEIYNKAEVEEKEVNERPCLVKKEIDYDAVDGKGDTNLERMEKGKPPLIDDKPVELHHMGQKNDGPLVELTSEEHRGAGNDGILHDKNIESEINRTEFKKEREQHWKARAAEVRQERGEA